MKLKLFLALIITATTIGANARPVIIPSDVPHDPVKFDRLNVIMKAISDVAVLGDERIEWVYPYFDPARSSVEQEKLYYSMKGSATNAPWPQNGKVTAFMETSYEVNREATIPGIAVKLQAQTNLDFLSFVRYAAAEALARIEFYNDVDENRARKLLIRAKTVQSLAEFKKLLDDGQKLGLDSLQEVIKKTLEKIDCYNRAECGNVTVDSAGNRIVDYRGLEWYQQDLKNIRHIYDIFEQNKIDLIGQSIVLTNPYPGGLNGSGSDGREARVKKWSYTFTTTSFALNSDIFVEEKISDLDRMKADIHRDLKKLELNIDDQQGRTQGDFKKVLQNIRKFIDRTNN